MKRITLENIIQHSVLENAYQIDILIDGKKIEISINPDDVELEKTIQLANKIIDNFDFYEKRARKRIIEDNLENYNEVWREDNEPELDELGFSKNLILEAINFLSDSSIDFFYSENGIFGNHSLIAQSFDGENFEDSTMYG